MHCKNCDWKLPYRYLVQSLIAVLIGLVVVGAYLGISRVSGSGGGANDVKINIPRPKR